MQAAVYSLLLLSLVSIAQAHGQVVELNQGNFDAQVGESTDRWFIIFYVPWCYRCTSVLPVWNELANAHTDTTDLQFGRVNCEANQLLCAVQGVGKYPVFLYYQDGGKIRYESKERELEHFQAWLASSPQVEYPATNEPVERDVEQLREQSQVIAITQENANLLEQGTTLVAFTAPWDKFSVPLRTELDELSLNVAENVRVATIDIVEQPDLAKKFEVRAVPVIQLHHRGEIYPHNGGRTSSFLAFFIKQITEPKVTDDEEEGMCRLVSDVIELHSWNIERHLKEKDHLFILFYAPWCRFCQEILPLWDNLADDDRFWIARLDAIEEEALRVKFRISGYPTMILWQRDSDQRTRYLGERKVADWTRFLEEHLHNNKDEDGQPAPSDNPDMLM